MNVLLRSAIGRRFLRTLLLISLPVIAALWFGLWRANALLRKQTHAVLRAASDGAEAQLREYLLSLKNATLALARESAIRSSLQSTNQDGSNLPALLQDLKSRIPEAQEITCIILQGRVVACSSPQRIGQNDSTSIEFQKGRHSFYPGDITRADPARNPRWVMSAPIEDSGRTLGVVALQVDPAALSALTTGKRSLAEGSDTQSFRIGETGETYIVKTNGLLLTESRYAPNAILQQKVETAPVLAARRQQEILADYKDYRGVHVSGSSALISNMGWVLITEIDFSQAFAPLVRLRNALIALAAGIAFFAALTGRRFARKIINPLKIAAEADRALARGQDHAAMIPEQTLPPDEIGQFLRTRNVRIKELLARQQQLVKEQQARAQAAADLQQLSYSMVHDMRAPLRAISTFGDILDQEVGHSLPAPQRQHLASMRTAALRMDKLICDMLQYSSLLQADVPLSPLDVAKLLPRVIEENPAFCRHSHAIQLAFDSGPSVLANAGLLKQCFSALLDNALRYTRPGIEPKIVVRTETKENRVVISIEDNGTGIPKQFKDKVFGIFQKGTNSSEGTGIALALVRLAVERMGGRIGVASEEGIGSRFWIELDAAG